MNRKSWADYISHFNRGSLLFGRPAFVPEGFEPVFFIGTKVLEVLQEPILEVFVPCCWVGSSFPAPTNHVVPGPQKTNLEIESKIKVRRKNKPDKIIYPWVWTAIVSAAFAAHVSSDVLFVWARQRHVCYGGVAVDAALSRALVALNSNRTTFLRALQKNN